MTNNIVCRCKYTQNFYSANPVDKNFGVNAQLKIKSFIQNWTIQFWRIRKKRLYTATKAVVR